MGETEQKLETMQTLLQFAKKEQELRISEGSFIFRQATVVSKVDRNLGEAKMKKSRTMCKTPYAETSANIKLDKRKLNVIRKTNTQRAVLQTRVTKESESPCLGMGSVKTKLSYKPADHE